MIFNLIFYPISHQIGNKLCIFMIVYKFTGKQKQKIC